MKKSILKKCETTALASIIAIGTAFGTVTYDQSVDAYAASGSWKSDDTGYWYEYTAA